MNRIFGGKKNPTPKPTIQDAIDKTDARSDSIQLKIKQIDGELIKYKQELQKGRNEFVKQKCLRLLKQKKIYEQQLDQLQQQSFTMNQANMTKETLENTMITFDAMKIANKELKRQYKQIDVEKIEKVQDEMQDLLEMSNEVQDVFRNYQVDVDEDELNAGIFCI